MSYPLFSVYGIELEYMLVDKTTLNVSPVADKLLASAVGKSASSADFGAVAWSNELALHVIEMKTNGPRNHLDGLSSDFHENVLTMNKLLAPYNACLLPTGAHPWMDPLLESFLWKNEQNEIYDAYHAIFDCSGHGWTNLQSAHLNLPFSNDKEFALLHSAIRLLLPIMPALAASTPIIDAKKTGYVDTRLRYYQLNQRKIPSISGLIVPELIFSEQEYREKILHRMYADIAPYDDQGILQDEWLNSRGAIPKFDYGAIEVRILDSQECPLADVAIADCITETLHYLVNKIELKNQDFWSCERLADLFNLTIQYGMKTEIKDAEYLSLFGLKEDRCSANSLWQHIMMNEITLKEETRRVIQFILDHGNLAERILLKWGGDQTRSGLKKIYKQLADNLQRQELFL